MLDVMKGNWGMAVGFIQDRTYSPVLQLTSCKMRGLRVTMPDPRGRKSLNEGEKNENRRKVNTRGQEPHNTRTCRIEHIKQT